MIRFGKLLVALVAWAGIATSASAYAGLYVFGDSLSDNGNDALAIGTDPAQVITGNSYIPSKPYASGTFSNAAVWVQPFATALGLGPWALPSLIGGGDYAFGGARMALDGPGEPPSLTQQVGMFLTDTGNVAPTDALYVIAGGGNDARDAFAAAAAAPTLVQRLQIINAAAASFAQSAASLIDALQGAGAQHIVVWDVPDLGKVPAVSSLGAIPSLLGTAVSSAMNSALIGVLAAEPDVSLFDIFGVQNAIVADPAAFGLVNATDACGAQPACDPDTSLYWDGIHPTSGGHAIIADAMLAVAVPEPAEYALLVGGFALLAVRLRARRAPKQRG